MEDEQNPDESLHFFWDRRLGPTKEPEKNFMDSHFANEHEDYGYNFEKFDYPIKVTLFFGLKQDLKSSDAIDD